jgi:NAD(P)-dependent dehydrogenase (short-subunit alcohol dehydrogenase family)
LYSTSPGLALLKTLLLQTKSPLVCTARDPSKARANLLQQLTTTTTTTNPSTLIDSRVRFLHLDLSNETSIQKAAEEVKRTYGDKSLRLLINASGILKPEKSLTQVEQQNLLDHFQVNTIGPLLVSKHFAPLLAPLIKTPTPSGSPSGSPNTGLLGGPLGPLETLLPRPIFAHLSAKSGSIHHNTLGGWHSYRISKAALNQSNKCVAAELGRKGAMSVVLNPGVVETDLSKPHIRGVKMISPDESAGLLWNVIRGLKEGDNGGFWDERGKAIEW